METGGEEEKKTGGEDPTLIPPPAAAAVSQRNEPADGFGGAQGSTPEASPNTDSSAGPDDQDIEASTSKVDEKKDARRPAADLAEEEEERKKELDDGFSSETKQPPRSSEGRNVLGQEEKHTSNVEGKQHPEIEEAKEKIRKAMEALQQGSKAAAVAMEGKLNDTHPELVKKGKVAIAKGKREIEKVKARMEDWVKEHKEIGDTLQTVKEGATSLSKAVEEKIKNIEGGPEALKKAKKLLKNGKDLLQEGLEQLLQAEKKHKLVHKAGKYLKKGLEKAQDLVEEGKERIGEENLNKIKQKVARGAGLFTEVKENLHFDEAVEAAKQTGQDTMAAANDFMGTFSRFLEGGEEVGIEDLQDARSKLVDKLNNIGKEGFKRLQQGSALRNVLLERLDNIKKNIKDTLSRELQEGAVDALKIATDNNLSTRGLPWELAVPCALAPIMLKTLQFGHRLTLYFYLPQILIMPMLLIINWEDSCSYNLNFYAFVRIIVDTVFIVSSVILEMRLNAWYELNNGWEATPSTAQRMLWKETVVSSFGISALSTGKATLLFYDLEYESCLNIFVQSVVTPAVAALNIAAIILSDRWYCLPCEKRWLSLYVWLLAIIYMVTLAYHIGNLIFRSVLFMAYVNCCFCCKRCLKRSAQYIDSGLPNPIFHFLMKYFILRESLATTITKNRERRRAERDSLEERIRMLEDQIVSKKKSLKELRRMDLNEIKARQAINNVIGLTDSIFRSEFNKKADKRGAYHKVLEEDNLDMDDKNIDAKHVPTQHSASARGFRDAVRGQNSGLPPLSEDF